MTKNAIHTVFVYGKNLVTHFSCKFIKTENHMKGLCLVIFHIWKLYDQHYTINQNFFDFLEILISKKFWNVFVTEYK